MLKEDNSVAYQLWLSYKTPKGSSVWKSYKKDTEELAAFQGFILKSFESLNIK